MSRRQHRRRSGAQYIASLELPGDVDQGVLSHDLEQARQRSPVRRACQQLLQLGEELRALERPRDRHPVEEVPHRIADANTELWLLLGGEEGLQKRLDAVPRPYGQV